MATKNVMLLKTIMANLITRVAKLVPYSRRKIDSSSFATAYYFEPPSDFDVDLGTLLVVVEILSSDAHAEEVASLIIKTIGEYYYDQASSEVILERFESSLDRLNEELAELSGAPKPWLGKISAIVAIQAGNELHLSSCGTAQATLYRNSKTSVVSQGLTSDHSFQPTKTFSQIASGRTASSDKLLLSTHSVLTQIPTPELKTIIEDNSPAAAVAKLSDLLVSQHKTDRCAALVVEITTPSSLSNQILGDTPDEQVVGQPENLAQAAKLSIIPIVTKSIKTARSTSANLMSGFKQTAWPVIKNYSQKTYLWIFKIIFKNRRNTIIAGVIVLAAISGGIYWHGRDNQLQALTNHYQEALAEAETAQTLLSQGDKTDALTHLSQAKTLNDPLVKSKLKSSLVSHLKTLPQLKGRVASPDDLNQLISSQLDLVDGITRVKPTLAYLFGSGEHPVGLQLVGGNLYAVTQTGSVFLVDPTAGKAKLVASNPSIGSVTSITSSASGDGLYILTTEPSVWLYSSTTNTITKQQLSFGSWEKGVAIASYLTNLYILSPDAGQIYRHTKTDIGFSAKSPYFTAAQSSLTHAQSLLIDGSVETTTTDGQFLRFLSGQLGSSSITGLPNPPSGITQMQETPDANLLYLTDTTHHSIVEVTSDGKQFSFKTQYEADELSNLSSIAIDYSSSTVYALSSGKVYKFTLQ